MSMYTRSKYRPIADVLRAEYEDAEPGTKLPSERTLIDRFGVTRPTVRLALQLLHQEGLTYSVQGRGTFVAAQGFVWERLGVRGDLPRHFPMGVNEEGQGPVEPELPHRLVCWCADPECPLTQVLWRAWAAGRRVGMGE